MFTNYLKSALRLLTHNKIFTGINVIGLSLAFAASFIILLFVVNEFSYGEGFKKRKQIYREILTYSCGFEPLNADKSKPSLTVIKQN